MAQFVRQVISGWGNYPRETAHVYYPEATRDLATIIAGPEASYISAGLLRSYGDAALNRNGGVIRPGRLNRFLSWNPVTQTLEAEAGVTYEDIIGAFLPRGFVVPVTPGTKFVTLGGAIAADVHGKNHHRDGSLANFLLSFRLLTADGQILTCSRDQNVDVFWATIGGMGLTGIVLTAKIRLQSIESAYLSVDYQRAANLDEALELFCGDGSYRYSVAWIDCLTSGRSLGRSVLMRGNYLRANELPPALRAMPLHLPVKRQRSVPLTFPSWALNSLSVRVFNELYYRMHGNVRKVVDSETFFYPLDSVLHWNRIYGRRGFVQYQIVLPHDASRVALVQILEKLSRSGSGSFLAVLKTFGAGNEGLLSFPMAGVTLALDLPFFGRALLELLDNLDKTVLSHGGRVYLAKDARLARSSFEAMYPQTDAFRKLKERLDPEGIFSSSLGRRLGLVRTSRNSK